jgi:hypothetical protein
MDGHKTGNRAPFSNVGLFGRTTNLVSGSGSSGHPKTAILDAQKRMESMKKKAADKWKVLSV